jgi:hypothetical protein
VYDVAGPRAANEVAQRVVVVGRRAIHRNDHVTGLERGSRGRRPAGHVDNEQAVIDVQTRAGSDRRVEGTRGHPEVCLGDRLALLQLLDDRSGGVDRDRESDVLSAL